MAKQICVVFILDSLIDPGSLRIFSYHDVRINNVRSLLSQLVDFIFISVSRLFVILIV